MNLKGKVEVFVLNKEGKVIKKIEKQNVILNSGKEKVYSGDYIPELDSIGIGTDNTSPDSSQTGLLAEYRKEDASKETSGDFSIILEHTFTDFTETVDICEAGCAFPDGSYLNRVTFDPVTCDENNNIKIKFTITVTD